MTRTRRLTFEALEMRELLVAGLWIDDQILAKPGMAVEVPVHIDDAAGALAVDLTIRYDPQQVLFQSGSAGQLLNGTPWGGNLVVRDDPVTGKIQMTTFNALALETASGELFALSFVPKSGAIGESLLQIDTTENATQLNEGQLPVSSFGGSLLIHPDNAALVRLPQKLRAPLGGIVTVPIQIDNALDWLGADLVVDYAPDMFDVAAVRTGDMTRGWAMEFNDSLDGRLRIAMFDTVPVSGSGEIVEVAFQVESVGVAGEKSDMRLVNDLTRLNEGNLPVVLRQGSFLLEEATPPIADIVDVAPDPRYKPVDVVTVKFNEDVRGFDPGDLFLLRDDESLDVSRLDVVEITPQEYTIDYSDFTSEPGAYTLGLLAEGAGITDTVGNLLRQDALDHWVVREPPKILISESGETTQVAEDDGSTDTVSVVLDSPPSSEVVVRTTSDDPSESTVSPSSITFTPSNWDVAQNLTVAGVHDDVIDGSQTTRIIAKVDNAVSDDDFDGLSRSITVVTIDDDEAGFIVVESDGDTGVDESGTQDTFAVRLTAQPKTNVVLHVESSDSGEASVNVALLSFSPGNWPLPQTVIVTGVDDPLLDGKQTSLITITPDADLSDDDFGNLAMQTVTVTTTSDDINLPPTLDPIDSIAVYKNSPDRKVHLTGITAGGGESQILRVEAVSNSPQLIPHSKVDYQPGATSAVLTLSTALNETGVTTITVAVSDAVADEIFGNGDDEFVSRSFSVTIAAWQNHANHLDVSKDGEIVPLDALLIINELNQPNFVDSITGRLPITRPTDAPCLDVNGDSFGTPTDALTIINLLNELAAAEGEARPAQTRQPRVHSEFNRSRNSMIPEGEQAWDVQCELTSRDDSRVSTQRLQGLSTATQEREMWTTRPVERWECILEMIAADTARRRSSLSEINGELMYGANSGEFELRPRE